MKEITEEHKKRVQRALERGFNGHIGIKLVDLAPNEAVVSTDMRDELRQPHGFLHGGVTATLIDTAMAFAVITCLEDDERAVTVDLNVHYLRPHIDGDVICSAKVIKAGRRLFTVTGEMLDSEGKLLATALSTYSKI